MLKGVSCMTSLAKSYISPEIFLIRTYEMKHFLLSVRKHGCFKGIEQSGLCRYKIKKNA